MAISDLQQDNVLYTTFESIKNEGQQLIAIAQNLMTIISSVQGMGNYGINVSASESVYLNNLNTFCSNVIIQTPTPPPPSGLI